MEEPEHQRARTDPIEARLQRVLAVFGRGRWRISADVIDRAYDEFVDRVVDGRYPFADADRICPTILCKLVQKRPPRVELDRGRTRQLSEAEAAEAGGPGDEAGTPPRSTLDADRLHDLLTEPGLLTELEHRALEEVLRHESMTDAARAADMSRRDFRVRVGRAAEKLRARLRSWQRPPVGDDPDERGQP